MAKTAKQAAQELQGVEEYADTESNTVTSLPRSISSRFKRVAVLTVPTLVLNRIGEERALRFDSEFRISKVVDPNRKFPPATVANVTDMETGEAYNLLLNKVLVSEMTDIEKVTAMLKVIGEEYTPTWYVGKIIGICNQGKKSESVKYFRYSIEIVEDTQL